MKLIAEQVKALREKKKELLEKSHEFSKYKEGIERTSLDGIGLCYCIDFQEEVTHHNANQDFDEASHMLSGAEFVTDRNFDFIDIGTRFTLSFNDGDDEEVEGILTETTSLVNPDHKFISLDSDLGKALLGKKAGEVVTYRVSATGRTMSLTVNEIDTMREHYEHFIEEVPYAKRCSEMAKRNSNGEERIVLSTSQKQLLEEEIAKLSRMIDNRVAQVKKKRLSKILEQAVTEVVPEGEIGIGSHVKVLLQDGNDSSEKEFELIERAYSTEIASQYVERVSGLGNTLYGLHAGDTFRVRRGNKPILNGMVLSVENENDKKRVR